MEVLLSVLEKYKGEKDILRFCCLAIGVILSSDGTYNEFKKDNKKGLDKVLRAVEECYENNKRNKDIEEVYRVLKEEEDKSVKDTV